MGIAEKDGDLLTNQLVWLLEKPSQLQDTSWIKPGKVAWDWWNANNIYGVDFKAGINTATYKYYIDFASKYGLQYIILDEGWYKLGNVLDVVPEINIEELTAYAKSEKCGHHSVGHRAKHSTINSSPPSNQFAKWGIRGIKVDFMQRDDQMMIDFYHKVSRETAKRKMLVDFHGAQKPASMTRTWPNLISTEGVRGMEWSKWSADSEPKHNVTLPFTRMFLGPMDYTPGAMLNATKSTFAPIFTCGQWPWARAAINWPCTWSLRARCKCSLTVPRIICASRKPWSFSRPVPTEWDETKVLDARIAEYVAVARRNGRDWYVGAMTDWTPRELEIDFSFLPEGNFSMTSYQDGVNADRYASDYKMEKRQINRTTKLKVKLAPGGGWAARIIP